jgi:hypothetical protein
MRVLICAVGAFAGLVVAGLLIGALVPLGVMQLGDWEALATAAAGAVVGAVAAAAVQQGRAKRGE